MVDFENTEIAFHQKNKNQLKKAYWLFRMLASPALVKVGSFFTRTAIKARFPVSWVLKPSVFNHFCGGETIDACDPVINKLGEANVQTILDYSAEGKESDIDFDYTKEQIIATIDKAKGDPNIPYAVFKPTGVARFALLEKVQAGETLDQAEQHEFGRVRERFHAICEHAVKQGGPVMIDSEESWIQTVVDELVEELMFRYNLNEPLVFNTLQMYRHDRLKYLENFVERAREKRVYSAFKLVRGAYMEKERARAARQGYPSPIYPDKTGTDKAYDDAVSFCLDNIQDVAVCVGTHNELSCERVVEKIAALGIEANHSHVSFAQLLGMSDHISYNLAAAGYNVCKYVPYGPVKTVIPYLIRRAEENTSVAGQTGRELFLLRKELKRRKT
mgnify:CR=1 FL=1